MGLAGLLLPKSGRGPFSPLSPYLFRLMSSFWFCVAALYCCFFFLCHLSQSNRSASSRVSLLKIINSNAGKATARENVPPPPPHPPQHFSLLCIWYRKGGVLVWGSLAAWRLRRTIQPPHSCVQHETSTGYRRLRKAPSARWYCSQRCRRYSCLSKATHA